MREKVDSCAQQMVTSVGEVFPHPPLRGTFPQGKAYFGSLAEGAVGVSRLREFLGGTQECVPYTINSTGSAPRRVGTAPTKWFLSKLLKIVFS